MMIGEGLADLPRGRPPRFVPRARRFEPAAVRFADLICWPAERGQDGYVTYGHAIFCDFSRTEFPHQSCCSPHATSAATYFAQNVSHYAPCQPRRRLGFHADSRVLKRRALSLFSATLDGV